jgi:hypothetical protein
MDDREWMYMGRSSQSDFTTEWMMQTNDFLELAFGESAKGAILVLCPCKRCANRKRKNKVDIGKHLLKNGFTPDYTWWDPPKAYTNPTIYTRINEYTLVARSLHGDDYDPSSQDFDPEVVMRIGGSEKHGRYYLGDGVIDATSTPSLS